MFFPAADTIAFSEGGTEAMRISSLGDVHIGGTSGGIGRLNVYGSVEINDLVSDPRLIISGNTGQLTITQTDGDVTTLDSTGTSTGIAILYGSTFCVFDNASGRVGIGTATPSSTLQVVGTVTATTFSGSLSGNATTASNALGYNQTWQDVSASRAAGTTYTNSTGRPIFISVRLARDDGTLTLTVDGLLIGATGTTAGPQNYTLTAIIPAGSTYSVTISGPTLYWYELR